MQYVTKEWQLDAFEYDPYGYKPDWFLKMIETGHAFEFKETEKQKTHAQFKDKRSEHKAFVGDMITRDVFGRIDVYSAKNCSQRIKLRK